MSYDVLSAFGTESRHDTIGEALEAFERSQSAIGVFETASAGDHVKILVPRPFDSEAAMSFAVDPS